MVRLALALVFFFACAVPAFATPWLFVTDIHFDPTARQRTPALAGDGDSNLALLDSALAEMRRVDPHPPVVVVGGDELAHKFNWSRADATMSYIAHRLDRAFPDAQFVMTLGNEDSGCGDYEITAHSKFLRDVARAWEPLVNRHGAAPGFATTFPRDAFYVARLPIANLQVVAIDDVYWSPRYRSCAPDDDPSATTLAELRRALRTRRDHWILLHIPPGIDAFSTAHLAHRLVVVPFLDPGPREALEDVIADPASRVTVVLAAHTHKLAYRIVGPAARPVPMLLMPSVSPIFGNAPGFVTANVDPDGTLRDVDSYGLNARGWHELGGFRALGVDQFTGPALVELQRRLAHDAALRDRFAVLYEGGGLREIDARNWPVYWCSATTYSATDFRACTNVGGTSVFTSRGLDALALAAVAVVAAVVLAVYGFRRRRAAR